MEPNEILAMVNSFDDATKANLKRMLYGVDDRSEGFNVCGNNRSIKFHATRSRESSPLYDEFCNARASYLQVKLIFNSYQGEGDPIDHIKAFEMKLELKFGVDDNLMVKYFSTILWDDALNFYA